jgi:hypothetical protein
VAEGRHLAVYSEGDRRDHSSLDQAARLSGGGRERREGAVEGPDEVGPVSGVQRGTQEFLDDVAEVSVMPRSA